MLDKVIGFLDDTDLVSEVSTNMALASLAIMSVGIIGGCIAASKRCKEYKDAGFDINGNKINDEKEGI